MAYHELLRFIGTLISTIALLLGFQYSPNTTIYDFHTPTGTKPSHSFAPVRVPNPTPQVHSRAIASWHRDSRVSWYGPGFYGKRTACGKTLTKTILGVAHRTLPCGTLVTFRWKGVQVTVPVIDRGPFTKGRTWDLSGGLCVYLSHCFTGPIEWRLNEHN